MSGWRVVIAVMALATIGVGIPIGVLVLNADSQSREAPGGVSLTASEQHGRELFARNCATCHTLAAANSVGKVAPNLDRLIGAISARDSRVALISNAIANGRARGNGQMPRGLLDGTDAADVAAFVSRTAGRR